MAEVNGCHGDRALGVMNVDKKTKDASFCSTESL